MDENTAVKERYIFDEENFRKEFESVIGHPPTGNTINLARLTLDLTSCVQQCEKLNIPIDKVLPLKLI